MAVKKEAIENAAMNLVAKEETKTVKEPRNLSKHELIAKVKKEAFAKRKVIITYNDKRDNNETNSAYLTCENMYFSLSKLVPLDTPVELEQCLINTAKEAKISVHRPDIVKGVQNSAKIRSVFAPKYTVSYED